jgi:hypothetical protein
MMMLKAVAVTRISVASGNWTTAATWNPAGAPACGDSLIISPNTTVNINNQQNYNSCVAPLKIIIYGTLKFNLGSKLSLPCGSYIIVHTGGLIIADVGLANSNLIEICNVVCWNSNAPLPGPACIPITSPICGGLLPIGLSGFRAEACSSNRICLSWETESEINNDHFIIERSNDAANFEKLVLIPSSAKDGNSNQKLSYAYIDEAPQAGMNYYRLVQVDKNFSERNSNITAIQYLKDENISVLIYPSCNEGEFTLVAGGNPKGQIRLLIQDAIGTIVFDELYVIDGKNNVIKVSPGPRFHPGIYYCSVQLDEKTSHSRIVVK